MYYSWWSWAIPLQILLLFKAKKTQIGTINVQTNRQGEKWNLKLSKTLQIVHKLLPLQGVKAVTHDFFYYNDKSGLKICLPPPYQKIPCTVTEIADSQVRQFQLHFILVYWSRYNLPCTYKQPDCAETVIKWIVTPIPTCLYLILTRWIYLKDDILIQNDMYVPPGISSTSSATRNYYPLLHNPNDCDLLSEQIAFQIYLLNAVYFDNRN